MRMNKITSALVPDQILLNDPVWCLMSSFVMKREGGVFNIGFQDKSGTHFKSSNITFCRHCFAI